MILYPAATANSADCTTPELAGSSLPRDRGQNAIPVHFQLDYHYSSRIFATDPDGDAVFYALELGQSDFAINQETGEIVSYSALAMGNYPIRISISDRRGGVINYDYSLLVSGVNTAPTLSPSQTRFNVSAGDVITFDLNVFDAEGDQFLVTVTDSDVMGFSVEPYTGQATWEAKRGRRD